MLFSRALVNSMVLVMATMLATPAMAGEPNPDYQVDVLALYAGNNTANSVVCVPYTPSVDSIIDHEFAMNGLGTNTTRRTLLRGNGHATNERQLMGNCAAICAQYPPGQCHYWTNGQCSGRRKLEEVSLADNGGDFPAHVHTTCADRKHIMLQGLYMATVSTAVDSPCKTFIADEWQLDCLVKVTADTCVPDWHECTNHPHSCCNSDFVCQGNQWWMGCQDPDSD